jgi:hypothetical protein
VAQQGARPSLAWRPSHGLPSPLSLPFPAWPSRASSPRTRLAAQPLFPPLRSPQAFPWRGPAPAPGPLSPLAFGLLGGPAASARGASRSPGQCGQGGCPAAAATLWGPPVSPKGSRPLFISLLPMKCVSLSPQRSLLARRSLLSFHRPSCTEPLPRIDTVRSCHPIPVVSPPPSPSSPSPSSLCPRCGLELGPARP